MPFCVPFLVVFMLRPSLVLSELSGQIVPVPVGPRPHPATEKPLGPKLDAHLAEWEKTIAAVKNIRFDFTLRRTDPAAGNLKGETNWKGSLVAMRPNMLRLRLDNAADTKDFEAFINNGKSLYIYNGLQKTITEHKLLDAKSSIAGGDEGSPNTNLELKLRNWRFSGLTRNVLLELLCGMTAQELKARFEVRLIKVDADYIYLDLKPLVNKDRQDFNQLRVALIQPKHPRFAYLPAQVYLIRPNGQTEQWKLSNHMTNVPEINEKVFQMSEVPGFRFQKAPEPKLDPVSDLPPPMSPVVQAPETVMEVPVAPCNRVRGRICGRDPAFSGNGRRAIRAQPRGLPPLLAGFTE